MSPFRNLLYAAMLLFITKYCMTGVIALIGETVGSVVSAGRRIYVYRRFPRDEDVQRRFKRGERGL